MRKNSSFIRMVKPPKLHNFATTQQSWKCATPFATTSGEDSRTFGRTISVIIPESQPADRGDTAIKNCSFCEREMQERKGCFGWLSTHPVRVQWANQVTKRLTSARATWAFLDPRYRRNFQHRQDRKRLLVESLVVDGLAISLLVCSKWFRFATGRLMEHLRHQRVSTTMCDLVWFYLSPLENIKG